MRQTTIPPFARAHRCIHHGSTPPRPPGHQLHEAMTTNCNPPLSARSPQLQAIVAAINATDLTALNMALTTQPIRDQLQAFGDATSEIERLNAAVDDREERVSAARQRVIECADAHTSANADLAMMVGDSEAREQGARLKKLVASERDARDALAHEERIAAELGRRLMVAETAFAELSAVSSPQLKAKIDSHLGDIIHAELMACAEALAPLLRIVAALGRGAQAHNLARALQGCRIADPHSDQWPILDGPRLRRDSAAGSTVDLTDAWQDDSRLLALHDAARAPRDVLAKVTGYTPRSKRLAVPAAYQRKGFTYGGRTEELREARAQAEGGPPTKDYFVNGEIVTAPAPTATASVRLSPKTELLDGGIAHHALDDLPAEFREL